MKELIEEIIQFRDERDWKQFHNAKDLAISLSLEASELLENFQWKTSGEAIEKNIEKIKDELADVVIYSILLSSELSIDLEEIVKKKMEKNNLKYPIEKSKGTSKKYTQL
ncbi:nucleotide pyrophosphohydrolase [Bacillus sp. FJAT-29790]|uniref:nucleotide pyrophosphohydrolase n=1 Tax=Bacillus sp. FJAT-29790 TaxID=1895002 RepID=UPI001C21F1D1|nr:nucleotide pyrophosphohydrolase [Bacillus sp. FJAT-29790]MBU8877955.1 nucleotide pyrophosphohydrolase [Bacillus sp. FJAT-29790]